MQFVSWLVGSTCVAIGLVALRFAFGRTPPTPRTHLFENEDGERENPFSTPTDEATAGPTCRECREPLSSDTYRYCGTCFPAD